MGILFNVELIVADDEFHETIVSDVRIKMRTLLQGCVKK